MISTTLGEAKSRLPCCCGWLSPVVVVGGGYHARMSDSQTKDVGALIGEQPSARPLPAEETTLEAILNRAGGKRMSPEEFDRHFGDLPTDGEG
jgi:hypothetical protein